MAKPRLSDGEGGWWWRCWGGREGCCHPGQQGHNGGELGGKLNILNAKYCSFLCSTNFKILSQIPGNSINKL
jgi:hypothetical protein